VAGRSVAEGVPKGYRNVRDARNERTRGVGVRFQIFLI